MTRVDLRAALDMLPRLNFAKGAKRTDKYCSNGRYLCCNYDVLPSKIDSLFRRVIAQIDASKFTDSIEWVDVSVKGIWVMHRCLKVRNLMYLYRQCWKWQRWKRSRLPIYIRYHGKLVIWNGTHRATLGRLAGRKVRARVLDIDAFFRYKKNNPKTWRDVEVITFKPKKKGKRK